MDKVLVKLSRFPLASDYVLHDPGTTFVLTAGNRTAPASEYASDTPLFFHSSADRWLGSDDTYVVYALNV